MEQGFNIDDGTATEPGDAFGRQSYLGISGNWGQIAFGRIGALGSDDGTYTIMGGSAYATKFSPIGGINSAFIVTEWMDNTVVYKSPEFSGLQLTAMYSNAVETDDSEGKWSTHDHYYGLGATYSNGALNANAYWEMLDNKTPNAGEPRDRATNLFTVGASYDFGCFKLYGSYQYALHSLQLPNVHHSVSMLTKGANQHALSLSVSVPAAGGTFMLQSQGAIGKIEDTDSKYNAWSVGAAYLYPLSKRTLVYFHTTYGETGRGLKEYVSYGWAATMGLGHTF